MRFDILTIFPEVITPYINEGVIGRAKNLKETIEVHVHNIRDYTTNKHNKVDDKPFGGGPGMILQVEPIYRALDAILSKTPETKKHIIFFKAGGTMFTQQKVEQFANDFDHIIMICGRYEGIDARVEEYLSHEAISIGQFVLTGGELASLIVLDAVSRYVPDVLGNAESTREETWATEGFSEYPQYSRPEIFEPEHPTLVQAKAPDQWTVPETLLSGNHAAIDQWRKERSQKG